ncbi:MAG: hypothetical protein Q9187_009277, partial [Circinaria calcarea]
MPPFPRLDPTIASIIRDDLRLSTWLLLGACLQSLLFLCLPTRIALLPATLILGARIVKVALMVGGLIRDTTQEKVIKGRVTAQLPLEGNSGIEKNVDEEIVVFIIGARSNHPLSRFAPGFLQAGDYFQNMWKEAESDRAASGYLGRSSDMLATDDETGNAIITLSYWKSMAHLHEFAQGPAHREGWDWFNRMTKSHPHLGMMHEVYAMPKGHWENIYKNFTPFGMGQTQHLVGQTGESNDAEEVLASPL